MEADPMHYANMLSLVAGLALLLASAFCAGRHILLQPKPEGWPSVSTFRAHVLFAWAVALLFGGLKLITVVIESVQSYPPNATPLLCMFSLGLSVYEGAGFVDEYRQWRVRIAALSAFRAKGYSIGHHQPGM
jgi:hypothetical protein